MVGYQRDNGDDAAAAMNGSSQERNRPAAGIVPGSTPSTWVGIYVLISVAGLYAIRRSFRRFM